MTEAVADPKPGKGSRAIRRPLTLSNLLNNHPF